MKINVECKGNIKVVTDDIAAIGSTNHFNRIFAMKHRKTPVRLYDCYIRPNGVKILQLMTLGGTLLPSFTQAEFNIKIDKGEITIKERDV